jgi:L-aspartate oxidase
MGGIVVDLHARSTVGGLYALGSARAPACTAPSRVGANSLGECVVFARRAARSALAETASTADVDPAEMSALAELEAPPVAGVRTREALWRDAGIERSAEGLQLLACDPHPLARLIARCASERRESRGAHRRVEYPNPDPALDDRHMAVSAEDRLSWETWL